VSVTVLWAVGDTCPWCSQPLYAARRQPKPDGVPGKTLALLHAESPTNLVGPRRREAMNRAQSDPRKESDSKHLAAVARSLQSADEAAEHEDYADAPVWLQAVAAAGQAVVTGLDGHETGSP
jgi:hypothetical protein